MRIRHPPRAALRRTLSTLKTALGDKSLNVERETIGLDTKTVNIDVLEFRAFVQQNTFQSLTRAARLYQGDFLDGFTLATAPPLTSGSFLKPNRCANSLPPRWNNWSPCKPNTVRSSPRLNRRAVGSRSTPCMNPRTAR